MRGGNYTFAGYDPDDGLTDGRWVQDGFVMRWETWAKPDPEPIDITQMIACPYCRARVGESCKTISGRNPREAHTVRVMPRRCPCGDPVAFRKLLCEPCRKAARAATYAQREQRRPTSNRRRAAEAA